MTECFADSCTDEAIYRLTYSEKGTPRKKKDACRYHKNMETIHDPMGVKAELMDSAP